jgi:hypothetical protein
LRNLLKKNADDAAIASADLCIKISKRKESDDSLRYEPHYLETEIRRLNLEIVKICSKKDSRKSPYTIGDDNLVSLARNAQKVADEAKVASRNSGQDRLV